MTQAMGRLTNSPQKYSKNDYQDRRIFGEEEKMSLQGDIPPDLE